MSWVIGSSLKLRFLVVVVAAALMFFGIVLQSIPGVLMTTFTTGLALVPLSYAGDIAGHEIEHPMAVVILGGLITSTLLNLFVVPPLYLRFGRRKALAGVNVDLSLDARLP